jgi:hypothetical protein
MYINVNMYLLLACLIIADCKSLYDAGVRTDGVYSIAPRGGDPSDVFCDMTGGVWTLVQKRYNGKVSFARNYIEYIDGFGSVDGDHWLGPERMHLLTSDSDTTSSARISVETYDGIRGYQHYGDVWVGDRDSDYTLHVTESSQDMSTLPEEDGSGWTDDDALYHNDGWGFTAIDRDVDGAQYNCADWKGGGGGWWYNWCSNIYINAIYGKKGTGGIRLFYNNDYLDVTNPSISVMRN